MKKLILKINKLLFLFFIISCNDKKETNSYMSIKEENERLRIEIDSLKNILEIEKYKVITILEKYDFNNEDSLGFLIALAYSRHSLVNKITYDVFMDKNSAIEELNNHDDFGKTIYFDNENNPFSGTFSLYIKDFKKGVNFLAGKIHLHTKGNKKAIPFFYEFMIN